MILAVSGSALWLGRESRLATTRPSKLRLGVLPDRDEAQLRERYAPLLAHLSQATGVPCELVVPTSYADLLERFAAGQVELAFFGGLTFVRAQRSVGAQPIVMREVDTRFTSVFVVRGYDKQTSLRDFRGQPFAFGPRLSTSGHLMPRSFLKGQGIRPETFFSKVRHSGGHDETVRLVRDGVVAIGAANSRIVRRMLEDGRLAPGDVHVLLETPPFPGYVWAAQRGLDPGLQRALTDGFMSLSPSDPSQARVLRLLDCQGFLPAGVEDYRPLERIVDSLGLLERGP